MQNGTDAKVFTSPAAPSRNVTARLDASGDNVIVSWNSGGGAVVQYAVERTAAYGSDASTSTVSSATFAVTNTAGYDFQGLYDGPSYRVRADFLNGSSSYSEYASVYLRL